MNIYLARHAQKDTSLKKTEEDHYNRGLTNTGKEQAKLLARQVETYNIKKIFSSNMPRAIQTAQAVASKLKINKIYQSKDLREADPCIIPNHPNRDAVKILCWNDWNFKPEHGESYNEGKARFSNYFWGNVVNTNKNNDNILIISHGRVMRLFLSDFLKKGKKGIKETYSHVAITHLKIEKGNRKIQVINYNDNSFLPPDLKI